MNTAERFQFSFKGLFRHFLRLGKTSPMLVGLTRRRKRQKNYKRRYMGSILAELKSLQYLNRFFGYNRIYSYQMPPATLRLAGSGLQSKCLMAPSSRLLSPKTSLARISALKTNVTTIATRKNLEILPKKSPERRRSIACNASAVAAAGK
jgi:hypothetical protein